MRTVTLDGLTILEILFILGQPFCDDRKQYIKYGTNLKACYEAIEDNDDHAKQVNAYLGLRYTFPFEVKVLKELEKYLKPKQDVEALANAINDMFENDGDLGKMFKEEPPTKDQQGYQMFRDKLFDKLQCCTETMGTLGIKLVKEKKAKNNEGKKANK